MVSSASSVSDSTAEDIELPVEISSLVDHVEGRLEAFALGDADVSSSALLAAKFLFDKAVSSESPAIPSINSLLAEVQPDTGIVTRSIAKRKRSPSPPPVLPMFVNTPLDSLFVNGMTSDQIWEQLELRSKNVCAILDSVIERDEDLDDESASEADELGGLEDMTLDAEDDEDDEDLDEDDDEFVDDEPMEDNQDMSADDSASEGDGGGDEDLGEAVTKLREELSPEPESEEDRSELLDLDRPRRPGGAVSKRSGRPRHPILDKGFFSIDEFNRQTEEMEAKNRSSGALADDDDEDEVDDDVDLFAAVPDLGAATLAEDEAKEPFYGEFFDAPVWPSTPNVKGKAHGSSSTKPRPTASISRKRSVRFSEDVRVKNIKAVGKSRSFNLSALGRLGDMADLDDDDDDDEPPSFGGDLEGLEGEEGLNMDLDESDEEDSSEGGEGDSDAGDDEERGNMGIETIERLKDDLFAEDEQEGEDAHLSNHEKRVKALSEQIKTLETENVGPKNWTLVGEANARSRPENSLLEEDLEFEHAGKQVPVITEEVTKSLEDRIKARILESRFDDVVRRRPADDKAFLPSRIVQLQDTQSQKSLAQIYEDEYTAAKTGDKTILDDRDGKLAKEHQEIERIWGEISYKLDALCNAHFTPKQPKATISTVSNVASATMENALPTAVSTSTMLAPEEVFTHDRKATRAKAELTPTEKRATHMKEKKAKKKQREALDSAVDKFARAGRSKKPKSVKEAKEKALQSLVKTGKGVTVVGKPHAGKELDKKRKRKETSSGRIEGSKGYKL